MVSRLAAVVQDLGHRLAGDTTALCARRGDTKRQEAEAKLGLPQPAGGRKEYFDEEGKLTKVGEWFGYKLHLLVDVRHELAVAYSVTEPAVGDNEMIEPLLKQAHENLPKGRIESLAYDKAADDSAVHRLLHKAQIKPLIENRALWKSEPERMLPGHTGRSNLVYDESGTIHCYDKVSTPMVRHRMAYIGHELKRGTLKYRCPARHEGWSCPSDAPCNGERRYGLVARIKSELDLRRFPPIPRSTKQFERLYKGRTAVERVNARLKLYWGADDGNVVGARRFHAMVGIVLLVHLALATTLARSGRGMTKTLGGTRLGPIAEALNKAIERERSSAQGG
jgi:Transposase DDE domain